MDDATKTANFFKAMRPTDTDEGKWARFGTEAYIGTKQMSHTTNGAKITAQCAKFDLVFPDLGEFLKKSENFDLSDMGFLAEMAGRVTDQSAKWAKGAACDATCMALTSGQEFTALKSIDSST